MDDLSSGVKGEGSICEGQHLMGGRTVGKVEAPVNPAHCPPPCPTPPENSVDCVTSG